MKTTRFLSWRIISGLAMLFFVILSAGLCAQDNPKNSLMDGSWSMQFRISNNLTLTTFDGALISAKKHLSDKTALRFGVDMNWSYLSDDLDGYNTGERNRSDLKLGIKTQIMKYVSPKSKLSFYFGIGPNISFSRSNDEYDYIRMQDSIQYVNSNYTRTLGLGLLSSWGLEWFFTNNMSLLAEYGAGMAFQFQRNESVNETRNQIDKITQFKLFSDNVNFGLSIYF